MQYADPIQHLLYLRPSVTQTYVSIPKCKTEDTTLLLRDPTFFLSRSITYLVLVRVYLNILTPSTRKWMVYISMHIYMD